MPAIANIVLNDGLATPVAHTFAPAKTQADMALLEDRVSGFYVGFNKLSFQLARPKGSRVATANRNLKLVLKIETPKLETLGNAANGFTPSVTVAYRPVCEVSFTLPERATLQDRKDLHAYGRFLLQHPSVYSAIENFELPY